MSEAKIRNEAPSGPADADASGPTDTKQDETTSKIIGTTANNMQNNGTTVLQGLSEVQKQGLQQKLRAIWTLHMLTWMLLAETRTLIYLGHFKGDTMAVARVTSRGMVAMMSSGMLLAPVLSSIANDFGRRRLLLLGPAWGLALRSLELLRPTAPTLMLTTALGAVANATLQGVMTCVADLAQGDAAQAGGALAGLQVGTTLGAVLGPALASLLASRGPRVPIAAATALAGLQVALVLRYVPETSTSSPRKEPMKAGQLLSAVNPAKFLTLFMRGPRLAAMALAQLLAHLVDPILLSRTASLVHAETLGWDALQRGRHSSMEAALLGLGACVAGRAAQMLGALRVLLIGVGAAVSQKLLNVLVVRQSWQQLALLPLTLPQGLSGAGLNTLLLSAAEDAGLGSAELRGYLQSLQSAAMLVAFPLWTAWFSRCVRDGQPRRFYAGVAVLSLVQLAAALVSSSFGRPAEKPVLDHKSVGQ